MRRSAGDGSVGANATNRVPAAPDSPPRAAQMPAAEPPPLAPIERVVEIFERFFLPEPELLGELARCDTADLVKLFGSPSRRHDRTSPAVADVSTWTRCPPTSGPVPAEPEHGPAWEKADAELSGAVLQVANPPEPKWDSNGYRISPPHHRYFRGRCSNIVGRIGAGEAMRLT
jgi:hypothetical protein